MQNGNTIKQWAKDDRPREKLLAIGADKLSNSELLAILIHNGTSKKSALDLAKEMLKMGNDSLDEMGRLGLQDLMKIKGIGEAKAVTIAAALELGRRRQLGRMPQKSAVTSSNQVADFLRERLKDQPHEVFGVLFLNRGNRIISFDIVSQGGITGTVVDPRIILKKALEKNAVAMVLCHNHPSGNLKPSLADEMLTEKIKKAAGLFDIAIIDHVIVSHEGYYSFADGGIL